MSRLQISRSTVIESRVWWGWIPNSYCKGQLISKWFFGVFKLTKKTNEIFVRISALDSKNCEINQIKALSYNNIIYILLYGLFNVLKTLECLYLMIWPLFRFLGRNLSNIFDWFFGKFKFKTSKGHSEIN